ncbi:MAG: hypothetical protein IKU53_00300 [Firmicutes bacterium]|nr:hypothetical protein [Bacillota bacterium]
MKRRIITILFVLVIGLLACTSFAFASDTIDYEIYGTYDYDAVQEVFYLVNEHRVKQGLPRLTLDPNLTDMAMQRAAECSVYYDHIRPSGYQWTAILLTHDSYIYGNVSENIAAGYTSAASTVNGWLNSECHRENIESTAYRSTGIGCFYQEDGTMYWTQIFHSTNYGLSDERDTPEYVDNITIASSINNFNIYLDNYNGSEFDIYSGMSYEPRFYIANPELEYGSNIYLSGGYSFTSKSPSIASTTTTKIKGVSPGNADIDFEFNYGYVTIPHKVVKKPTLSSEFDSDGDMLLTLNGQLITYDNVGVYYKEKNDSYWTRANINNSSKSCTIYNTRYGETYTFVVQYQDAKTGKWVKVSDSLSVTKRLATPKIKVATLASSGKPKVTWNAVDGADKYEVWRKVGADGTYKKMYVTTKTSYTNKTAIAGTKYYYRVRAIYENNSAANSLYSSPYAISCDLAAPANVKVITVASTGKPKLTWDSVEGADQYEVWRKVGSNGTYKKMYITTNTSYTNNTAVVGTKYYYKVKAICNSNANANSAFSAAYGVTCDLPAPTSVTVTTVSSTGKPKVTWKAVEGADQYEVWRKVGANGEYKKYYITTGTTLNNTSTVAGTKYYYKVKAIYSSNANANSSFSNAYGITCDLAAPSNVKVSIISSTGKPKLSWSAVDDATKYEVWRKVGSSGEYKLLKTITGTSTIHTSAAKGTTYYYKVKAIHGTTENANSAFSAVVSKTSK